MFARSTLILVLTISLLSGCVASGANTNAEKRRAILDMKNEALTELYKHKPQARAMIDKAPGYAVFSNANVNLILASFSGGYGVVRNMATGKYTYMKMAEAGVGLGLGAKDFRTIFVFHDLATMNRFIDSGWQFGGHADAAAKASDQGAAVGGELVVDNITIFQLTETGLALQATIKGTKYWKDNALNE